jgi:hypothetical protein
MIWHRLGRRLITRAHAVGAKEELIGDLMEEISDGRSQLWMWRQLVALYGFAAVSHIRNRARVTPSMIALLLCLLLVGGAAVGSARVIEAWFIVYYVAGTASLFAHMAANTATTRAGLPNPPRL